MSKATEIDDYRSANFVIKRHGEDALAFAARRAEIMHKLGEPSGERTWLRIAKAIEELTSTDRGDAPLH